MSLSVVIPAFNEAPLIAAAITDLHAALRGQFDDFEVIAVDDASTDGTGEVLYALAQQFPWLQVVRHPRNLGHGAAILTGYRLSRKRHIFQLDSDRQFWPTDFWRLYAKLDQAELIVGIREPRRDPFYRRLLSHLLNLANRLLFGQRLRDANSPFRLMHRDFLRRHLPHIPPTFSAPNLLLSLFAKRDNTLIEAPVRHRARPAGTSTLIRLSLLRFGSKALLHLIVFRLRDWPHLTF